MRRVLKCFAAISLLSFGISSILFAQNQSRNQKQGDQNHGGNILVDTFTISGTRAIGSAELAEITNSMAGSEFNNDTDELGERIRAQFQDRGYFQVEVQKVDMKVLDLSLLLSRFNWKPRFARARCAVCPRSSSAVIVQSLPTICERHFPLNLATYSCGPRLPAG